METRRKGATEDLTGEPHSTILEEGVCPGTAPNLAQPYRPCLGDWFLGPSDRPQFTSAISVDCLTDDIVLVFCYASFFDFFRERCKSTRCVNNLDRRCVFARIVCGVPD